MPFPPESERELRLGRWHFLKRVEFATCDYFNKIGRFYTLSESSCQVETIFQVVDTSKVRESKAYLIGTHFISRNVEDLGLGLLRHTLDQGI